MKVMLHHHSFIHILCILFTTKITHKPLYLLPLPYTPSFIICPCYASYPRYFSTTITPKKKEPLYLTNNPPPSLYILRSYWRHVHLFFHNHHKRYKQGKPLPPPTLYFYVFPSYRGTTVSNKQRHPQPLPLLCIAFKSPTRLYLYVFLSYRCCSIISPTRSSTRSITLRSTSSNTRLENASISSLLVEDGVVEVGLFEGRPKMSMIFCEISLPTLMFSLSSSGYCCGRKEIQDFKLSVVHCM